MCRIFGFLGDTSTAQHRAQNALDLLYHGGPDENGLTIHQDALLGNCRLAIMDVDNGSQPYKLGDKIEVVFNGEIYNHNELRQDLENKGYTFENYCDGSILPALYHAYGRDFVSHLDGMFAIAVLDKRGPTKLVLAVDHLGIKPLYYSWNATKGEFSFASEIPALACIGGINPSIWLPGVDEYLTAKVVTGDKTMYKEINVLTPQTMLTAFPGQKPKIQKWDRHEEVLTSNGDLTNTGKDLEELLAREVSSLLCADVPAATINSGGLDSSLVSALAADGGYKTQAFHLAYTGDWPSDERAFAHQVAERLKIDQHDIILDPATFPDLLPKVVRHLGQPFACPNNLSTYGLFRGVSEKGFKVVLSGDGADEMFGGYNRLKELVCNHNDASTYIKSLGILTPIDRKNLFSRDYRAYMGEKESATHRLTSQLQAMPGDTLFKQALEFERKVRLPSYHLHRVDHLSMAHSVEVRVPFCQRRVLDFARNTPSELLIDQNGRKKVLYAAASSHLPISVLQRPKQPFTLPVGAIFRKSGVLATFARDVLSENAVRSVGLFDPYAVNQLFEREKTCTTEKAAEALWSLMIFHLWADQSKQKLSTKPSRNQPVISSQQRAYVC